MRTSNKKASQYVAQKIAFKGNNTFGRIEGSIQEGNLCYKVYSYGTHFPIYAFKYNPDGETGGWYKNKDKYSISTSKHQSQLHPGNDLPMHLLSTEEMKAL